MANRRRRSQTSQQQDDDVNINPSPPPPAATRHPVYHGIRCRSGKWVSEIREPNKSTRIWLGTYPTPEMAATAHDVAAFALKGPAYAILNFPANSQYLSTLLPQNPTADDIRAAAATAAAAGSSLSSSSAASSQQDGIYPAAGDHFMDDEEAVLFGSMPRMISDMAEGMLLSPPRITTTSTTPPPDYYGEDNYNSSGSAGGGGNLWDY